MCVSVCVCVTTTSCVWASDCTRLWLRVRQKGCLPKRKEIMWVKRWDLMWTTNFSPDVSSFILNLQHLVATVTVVIVEIMRWHCRDLDIICVFFYASYFDERFKYTQTFKVSTHTHTHTLDGWLAIFHLLTKWGLRLQWRSHIVTTSDKLQNHRCCNRTGDTESWDGK